MSSQLVRMVHKKTLEFLERESKMTKPKAQSSTKDNKRGHYKQKECPYCHREVGNLGNHIRMVHKTEAQAEGYKVNNPPASKEDLLATKKTNDNLTPPGKIYYCTACHAKLKKGENPCWHCGEELFWEGTE